MQSKRYLVTKNTIESCKIKKNLEMFSLKKIVCDSINSKIYEKQEYNHTSRGQILIENNIFKTYIYVHYDTKKLLMAKRTFYGFNIYSIQENNKLIGRLDANIFGTKYKFINYLDSNLKQNFENLYKNTLEIKYETSFIHRGKPRSFIVYLNQTELHNKKPYFNNDTLSFSLNFNGRITKPSVRNFQIVHPLEQNYITLTFGKESNETYILDFSFPWVTIDAFCVALSALDHKFGCD